MNVLVFSSLYPNNIWPNHGVFVKERVTHFARSEGCAVKVVAPVPYFPPVKLTHRWLFSQVLRHEIRDEIDVYHPRYVMIPKVAMAVQGLTLYWSVVPSLKTLQRAFAFDVIDAHYMYPDGFAAVLLGRIFRKPVVVSARGSDINRFRRFPVIRQLLRYTLKRADKVIAVSEGLKQAILPLGLPAEKISVVPNGVNATKFSPSPKDSARRTLSLPHKRIILSVGSLKPVKGFDLLIKAFKTVLTESRDKDLYLVIAGDGPLRNTLQRLISSLDLDEHVHLAGSVPHHELGLWYSAADLFCLASRHEGWPNVLLEALACGTPVVATAVGGIPEIIRSDTFGLLTRRSVEDLARTIARALRMSWQPSTLVRYAASHGWDHVAAAHVKVLQSLYDPGTESADARTRLLT